MASLALKLGNQKICDSEQQHFSSSAGIPEIMFKGTFIAEPRDGHV